MNTVIHIKKRHPETALENLNRLTGLDFRSWPESLLDHADLVEPVCSPAPVARGERGQYAGPDHDQRAAGNRRHAGGMRRADRR